MEWILKLFALFKRNSAEEYKAVIDGWKGLSEGYKERVEFLEARLEAVEESEVGVVDEEKLEAMEEQKRLLKQLIELTNTNRDLEEEIIFMKILYKQHNKN